MLFPFKMLVEICCNKKLHKMILEKLEQILFQINNFLLTIKCIFKLNCQTMYGNRA